MSQHAAEQGVILAGATATGAASVWSIANDVAQALFGVPIGVVLAAAAGAFFGRTFTPASSFAATVRGWAGWTLAGAYTLPLALHVFGFPQSIAASAAFVLAGVLQIMAPVLVPVVLKNSPAWLQAFIDKWSGRASGN